MGCEFRRVFAIDRPVIPEPIIAWFVSLWRVGDWIFERVCGGFCQYDDVGFGLGRPGSALMSFVTVHFGY